jgi:hypothetical protein
MSNHYSAANLRFPGDDVRLDLTDLFVFQSPADPARTVLIIDVNPFTTGISAMPPFLMKSEFHPDGVYRINIDNDGDARADAAFTFVFSEFRDGTQTGTAYYATGQPAQQPEPAGDVLASALPVGFDAAVRPVQAGPGRLFAGVRSDPFFADADGAFHGFNWTGQDAFANRNILSIALEVPSDMLGPDPVIGAWATVSASRTTWGRGHGCWSPTATRPRGRRRPPGSCCRTSCATTGPGRPRTPTAGPSPTTSSAPASRG